MSVKIVDKLLEAPEIAIGNKFTWEREADERATRGKNETENKGRGKGRERGEETIINSGEGNRAPANIARHDNAAIGVVYDSANLLCSRLDKY